MTILWKHSRLCSRHYTTTNKQGTTEIRSWVSQTVLTLTAYLMGCIEQSHTGDSVIEMHINLLFHWVTADTCKGKKHRNNHTRRAICVKLVHDVYQEYRIKRRKTEIVPKYIGFQFFRSPIAQQRFETSWQKPMWTLKPTFSNQFNWHTSPETNVSK